MIGDFSNFIADQTSGPTWPTDWFVCLVLILYLTFKRIFFFLEHSFSYVCVCNVQLCVTAALSNVHWGFVCLVCYGALINVQFAFILTD